MRILSWDRLLDLPYESIGVCISYNNDLEIIAFSIGTSLVDEGYWLLAKYSSADKARKAMEMLYAAYMVYSQYKIMTVEQRAVSINCTSEKEYEILSGVFQFPTDDELEV